VGRRPSTLPLEAEEQARRLLQSPRRADPADLLRAIHAVNPSDRGLDRASTERLYLLKSRLQSRLLREFREHVEVRPDDAGRPGVVSLWHRTLRRDAAHAVPADLEPDVRDWVMEALESATPVPPAARDRRDPRRADAAQVAAAEAGAGSEDVLVRAAASRAAYDFEAARALMEGAVAQRRDRDSAQALLELLVDCLGLDGDALDAYGRLPERLASEPALRALAALAAARSGRGAEARRLLAAARGERAAQGWRALARAALASGDLDEAGRCAGRARDTWAAPDADQVALEAEVAARRERAVSEGDAELGRRCESLSDSDAEHLAKEHLRSHADCGAARSILAGIARRRRDAEVSGALHAAAEAEALGDPERALLRLRAAAAALAGPVPGDIAQHIETLEDSVIRQRDARALEGLRSVAAGRDPEATLRRWLSLEGAARRGGEGLIDPRLRAHATALEERNRGADVCELASAAVAWERTELAVATGQEPREPPGTALRLLRRVPSWARAEEAAQAIRAEHARAAGLRAVEHAVAAAEAALDAGDVAESQRQLDRAAATPVALPGLAGRIETLRRRIEAASELAGARAAEGAARAAMESSTGRAAAFAAARYQAAARRLLSLSPADEATLRARLAAADARLDLSAGPLRWDCFPECDSNDPAVRPAPRDFDGSTAPGSSTTWAVTGSGTLVHITLRSDWMLVHHVEPRSGSVVAARIFELPERLGGDGAAAGDRDRILLIYPSGTCAEYDIAGLRLLRIHQLAPFLPAGPGDLHMRLAGGRFLWIYRDLEGQPSTAQIVDLDGPRRVGTRGGLRAVVAHRFGEQGDLAVRLWEGGCAILRADGSSGSAPAHRVWDLALGAAPGPGGRGYVIILDGQSMPEERRRDFGFAEDVCLAVVTLREDGRLGRPLPMSWKGDHEGLQVGPATEDGVYVFDVDRGEESTLRAFEERDGRLLPVWAIPYGVGRPFAHDGYDRRSVMISVRPDGLDFAELGRRAPALPLVWTRDERLVPELRVPFFASCAPKLRGEPPGGDPALRRLSPARAPDVVENIWRTEGHDLHGCVPFCFQFWRVGHEAAAMQLATLLHERHPRHAGVARFIAQAAAQRGDWDAVLRALPDDDIGQTEGGFVRHTAHLRAVALLRAGRFDSARTLLDRALAEPGDGCPLAPLLEMALPFDELYLGGVQGAQPSGVALIRVAIHEHDAALERGEPERARSAVDCPPVWRGLELQSHARLVTRMLEGGDPQRGSWAEQRAAMASATLSAILRDPDGAKSMPLREGGWTGEACERAVAAAEAFLRRLGANVAAE
jgi:hypothetical protein